MSRGSFGYEGSASYQSSARSGNTNDFARLSSSISNNIQKITNNVSQIQRMVAQIGTSQDNPELRDRLHQIQHDTNGMAKQTSGFIKNLSNVPQPTNPSDQRMQKTQKSRLVDEFTQALNNFQAAQKNAAHKEKDSVKRAKAQSGSWVDPFDDRRSDDQLVGFDSPQQQTSVQMEENVNLELMQERESAIRQLESDIVGVNEIFKDLGMLVHEQGEVIDSIESNVENAAISVESGRDQLEKAKTYQNKARRKKCICLIVLLIALAIIGLILGLTLNKKSS